MKTNNICATSTLAQNPARVNPSFGPRQRYVMLPADREQLDTLREQLQSRLASDYDSRMTYTTTDRATGDKILHRRRPVMQYVVLSRMCEDMPVTDTGHAYLYHVAQIMAMTALKTVEAKSADPYITRLINGAVSDRREIERIDGRSIVAQGNVSCTEIRYTSENDTEEIISHDEISAPMMERKHHTRRKIAGMYFPCDYDTLENTETGREILASEMDTFSPYMDCVHVAYCELLRLAKIGVITDYDSVWQFRRLVYKCVHQYINGQRSINSETAVGANILYANENGDEPLKTPRTVDRDITAIIDGEEIKSISEYVVSHAGNVNKRKFQRVFEMFAGGCTQAQISASVSMTQSNISRYIGRAVEILTTTEGKRFLASLF